MTVYCVRHGPSVANAGGMTTENAAIPLSALGLAQAAALPEVFASAVYVQPSRVLVLSYVGALQTAQPFCKRFGCQAEVDPLLHEFSALDASLLQGMLGAERRPLADAYWQTAELALRAGPGAETFFELVARVKAFAATNLPLLPDDSVLFGHGIWFALLFWLLMGFAIAGLEEIGAFRHFRHKLAMPNGAVCALDKSVRHRRLRLETAVMRDMARVTTDAAPHSAQQVGSALIARG